jgi:DNA polymerase-1
MSKELDLGVRLGGFREIWALDFEYSACAGERPSPICLVARELRTGRQLTLWEDDLRTLDAPPYRLDNDALLVAFYSSAEWGCHAVLGWPMPTHVLDLYTEFRCLSNGGPTPFGNGLLGALAYFGLDAMAGAEKDSMRELALRGGPWSPSERAALLDYCAKDVDALVGLLRKMAPLIDLPRAVLRGRYMVASARMENAGVPIDLVSLQRLRGAWNDVQQRLVARIDADYGVYDGTTFKAERFAKWLTGRNIAWPALPSGALALDDNTFRDQARVHPELNPLRELRVSLSQMRLAKLAVGQDGRNRCMLSAFRARTSRNQPSNSKFIFGPSVWLRGLIQPRPDWGLAYCDYEQQEFGIAAALSNDLAMKNAYQTGDSYLAFAKQAGAVPVDGSKATHGAIREQFKTCALGVQYGMEADSLAMRIGAPIHRARELLRLHHETYPNFWSWSDAAIDHAMLFGYLDTVFGWRVLAGPGANPRSLRNFPVQANGAEMLRLACCLATEAGIRVCAPVHDAMLIEAPLEELERAVDETQRHMREASAVVLDGFELRVDAKVIPYPQRYMDLRGERMWSLVREEVEAVQQTRSGPPAVGSPSRS